MLRHLHVENYTLIDNLDLEFRPGFNLLTGETGSGKSILVDAVELLLGGKASTELIRSGAERAQILGVFSASPKEGRGEWDRLRQLLADSGIELDPGDDLIVLRDILPGGKSRVFINHRPATVGLLRGMAANLAEVHGQNEQQELFSSGAQLDMLDRFGGLSALASSVRQQFGVWKSIREQQEGLSLRQQERLRQADLWQFQKREIEQAEIVRGEDERLEQEKLLLAHAARIHASLSSAYDLLYDSPAAALATVSSACRNMEDVTAFDSSLKSLIENLASAKVAIDDVALALRDRLSRLETSPQRLEQVEDRLALLDRLKRKYGPQLEDVVRYWQQITEQVREVESAEALGSALEAKVRDAAAAYAASAVELSARRQTAARQLKAEIENQLKALAMAATVFEARLTCFGTGDDQQAQWTSSGVDRVEFLISPNPGEPLRPLSRIASGGEISRIMLALEIAADSHRDESRDHTLIFDEVDAGIGGRAAETVGKKLRQLGETRQVLCVTHLPQIASFAHHHFRVEKIETNGRTVTRVQYLQKSERTEELARMLSGSRVTDAVMKHAEQLLKANS